MVPFVPQTTTENFAMRALLQFVTPEELNRNDWLGFDAALNRGETQRECDGGGCRARCYMHSCQSTCHGDTCSAGCIGSGCTSSCDGPGCLSMCIGKECKATCNGQACDARCKGSDCSTDCKSFSCSYVTNGKLKSGGGSWDQHYSEHGTDQYADGPQEVKPPTDQLRMGPMYDEDYNMDNAKSSE
ncbi:uncharacterized protein [Choristoneura fumiferana]|uniref:uncharacterized protein n=1 Tax=Choristoneura fumiferana TaxID=7141 RepID=UPI003D154722